MERRRTAIELHTRTGDLCTPQVSSVKGLLTPEQERGSSLMGEPSTRGDQTSCVFNKRVVGIERVGGTQTVSEDNGTRTNTVGGRCSVEDHTM